MRYIEGINRQQITLYSDMLDNLIQPDNPVRVVDAFVDELNLGLLGFTNTNLTSSAPGHPAYSPYLLLKLYIFGYFKKVRSSRKLMELCATNIEAMWLTGRLTPDFRTIANFRKDNAKQLKKVFKMFVRVCAELGLYRQEIGVQDGSKFRADNSKENNVTTGKLERKIKMLDDSIEKYLDKMDKVDSEESDREKYTKEEIEEKINILRNRKSEYMNLYKEMEEAGLRQVSFTDSESKLMKANNGGFDVSYNTQIVVDPESHMVGAIEVTNQCNDVGLLSSTTTQLKETLGIDVIDAVADKGYEDHADMLKCLENGTVPHVSSKTGADTYEFELDYTESEISEEMLSSTKPEDIKACLHAGKLPEAYKDKGVEVSVEEIQISVADGMESGQCFTLNEEGTSVICPNGAELNKVAKLHGKNKTRFTNKGACRLCENKCTDSAFKQVDLNDGQLVSSARRTKTVKKVKIRLKPDVDKLNTRKCVVEHPFGTVKRWMDGSYLLLRGMEKAAADMALLFLAYNIKRAVTIAGVQTLIRIMRKTMRNIMADADILLTSLILRTIAAISHIRQQFSPSFVSYS